MTAGRVLEPTGDAALWPTDAPATFEGRAMASPLRLTLGGATVPDPQTAASAWDAVVGVFAAAETAMSRFRETSGLTAVNRAAGTGTPVHVSPMLRQALVATDRAHRLTGGRFDPRVLADLDRLGYRGAPLEPGAIDSTSSERTDDPGRIVTCGGRAQLSLMRPVDLGGIGKGLALRWAAVAAERCGLTDFLLESGGDLVARGADPDGGPWPLGIEDPAGLVEHLAVIGVADHAVATSSTGVHLWTVDGRAVHHLIDPRTGEPADGGLAAVTVCGRDPAWAEVWSKVLFIGGRSSIAADARARGLAAWWIADDGAFEMTPAARALTTYVGSETGAG